MNKVVIGANIFTTFLYVLVAVFGYASFAGTPQELVIEHESNLLEVDYKGNIFFTISIMTLLFSVIFSNPFSLLPAKDSFEYLIFNDRKMTKKENFFVTLGLCFFCYLVALLVPDLTDALTFLGATINPLTGFILPAVFFLKLCPDAGTTKRLFAYVCIVFTVISCIAVLYYFYEDIEHHTFHNDK